MIMKSDRLKLKRSLLTLIKIRKEKELSLWSMDKNIIYNKIKAIVHSYIPDARVLLYGSRATNTMNNNSDFDLLIIVNNDLTLAQKMQLESKIDKALVWALDAPFDVILKDTKEVERFKSVKGHIIYYALKEAIVI